ncbi:hypothetical protein GCM10011316_17660 [Roseibium aquae]|uniref:PPM-type phosphatase domain-containing protein n=1 Tax=Roseibium aquae TaxID=1323746 RepID=A0A916TJ76_9HYPH|nr:PP2C family protein-serine/threonine phosphatase [Roseibium aquae]GGB45995.1 hypothetical protein GCM10011316_17660 [Roseibium aquae]
MNTETMTSELETLRSVLENLRAEHADLQLLYEATIEHGEAVEDQLAESNIRLQLMQDRLTAELNDAGRYVQSILPDRRIKDPQTDWLLVPSTELGGDSFGYHDLDQDHFAVYLIDVCGHGVGAALLSVSIINVLRASALPQTDFKDPSEVLFKLNNAFPMERQDNMFFTIWYGVYQRSARLLRFASGGHPPAIHLKADGGFQMLGTPEGMVIGAIADMTFEQGEAEIRPQDRLLVLSDGTFEIDVPGQGVLSVEDLARYACAVPDGVTPALFEWIGSLAHQAALPDDYTMVELRF